MRHLEENFKKKFKHPDLTKLLWTAARAITQEEYDAALENMTKINSQAVPWLLEHTKPEYWAELYFSGKRYGHLTSNIAESFNSCILEAREKPILSMLETIRHHLMDWYTVRPQSESTTQGLLVKNVANSIQKLANDRARRYRFYTNIPDVSYEVQSTETLKEYRVNLTSRTCSCRAWQSTGYPCSHALAIIITRKENPQQYAESFYSLNSFRQTYATPIIHPHNNENVNTLIGPLPPRELDSESDSEAGTSEDSSSDDDHLPPKARRQPGRPKKQRSTAEKGRREERRGDVRRLQHRSLCEEVGHSKRTCPGSKN